MECRPFNIDVMLVAPGAVKSNLAKNQAATLPSLPSNSLYANYLESIIGRMNASQGSGAMPTDEFAKRVVTKALAKRPPQYVSLGGFAFGAYILKWLPRTWVMAFLWKTFTRKR